MNTVETQGRDWRAYAKVRQRWVFETVSEFPMQERKERPSRLRGHGDTEAAREMKRSQCGRWSRAAALLGGTLGTRKGVRTTLRRQQEAAGSGSHVDDPEPMFLNWAQVLRSRSRFFCGFSWVSSCSWLFNLFPPPVPHPASYGQLEGVEEWVQTILMLVPGLPHHWFPGKNLQQLPLLPKGAPTVAVFGMWWRELAEICRSSDSGLPSSLAS